MRRVLGAAILALMAIAPACATDFDEFVNGLPAVAAPPLDNADAMVIERNTGCTDKCSRKLSPNVFFMRPDAGNAAAAASTQFGLGSFVTMAPNPGQQGITDPWLIKGLQGAAVSTTGSTTSGAQELANYIWNGAGAGLGAALHGKGGTASNDAYIVAQTTVSFHPLRNQSVTLENLGWYGSPANTGCALRLDSMIESSFEMRGSQIGINPTTGANGTCAVLVAPATPLPFEASSVISAGRLHFGPLSNSPAAGTSLATLIFDMANGAIVAMPDISVEEVNGAGAGGTALTTYDILFRSAATGTHSVTGNHFRFSNLHLAIAAGLQVGLSATEGAGILGNTWDVNGVYPGGTNAIGISTFGRRDYWTASRISNEQGTVKECMVFEASAANNTAYVDCEDTGTTILNGVRFDTGAVNNTVWLTTSGTVTNPVVDNSGGCNTVWLNGKLLQSCPAAPTIASGGCTTGSAQSISASNGSVAFEITLGGATCGSTITLTMPAAPHNWVCDAHNVTTPASNVLDMTGAVSTTAVVLTNFVRTTGVAGNFTGANKLAVKCSPY